MPACNSARCTLYLQIIVCVQYKLGNPNSASQPTNISHLYRYIYCIYLIVGQGSEGGEEGHGLAGPRRATEDHGFVLLQPGEQQRLVANSVQSRDHHVWRAHVVCLHLNLGHLPHPQRPLPLDGHLRSCDM